MLHLIVNPEQWLSLARVPSMPSSPSFITSYLPLFDTFRNTIFWSSFALKGKEINNKFCPHSNPNRTDENLAIFSQEQACLPKHKIFKKEGKTID